MFMITVPKCRSPTRRRVQLPAENSVNRKICVKKVVHFSNNSRVSKHR